jgi:hypothetical protein
MKKEEYKNPVECKFPVGSKWICADGTAAIVLGYDYKTTPGDSIIVEHQYYGTYLHDADGYCLDLYTPRKFKTPYYIVELGLIRANVNLWQRLKWLLFIERKELPHWYRNNRYGPKWPRAGIYQYRWGNWKSKGWDWRDDLKSFISDTKRKIKKLWICTLAKMKK